MRTHRIWLLAVLALIPLSAGAQPAYGDANVSLRAAGHHQEPHASSHARPHSVTGCL
jgi:hypothetical protein